MQMGAYTVHVTWRTPGPHCTPLRVTPAEPAAAGAVMPLGTASARCPPVPPAPVAPAAPGPLPPAAPATVVSVVSPFVLPVPTSWPKPAFTSVALFGDTLGTSHTTKSRTRNPINSGEYRRATLAI